jgi:hypothetical protein
MNHKAIAKHFGKARLLALAEELELSLPKSTRVLDLVATIEQDMEQNGILEGEVSDDMWTIMLQLEFIDEDGVSLDGSEGGDEEEPEDEPEDESVPEEERPDCFGLGDVENDSACRRCKISAACMTETLNVTVVQRPCWGEYEKESDECAKCVLWRMCKEAVTA